MSRDLDPALLAAVDQEMAQLKVICTKNSIPWTLDTLGAMHLILDSIIFALDEELQVDSIVNSMHVTVVVAEELMEQT